MPMNLRHLRKTQSKKDLLNKALLKQISVVIDTD